MNKSLLQINDNYGAVSDENGNIKEITKENNNYEFKDILLKENYLQELNEKLNSSKEELSCNKYDIIGGEITSVLFVVTIILIWYFGFKELSLPIKIISSLMFFPLKGICLLEFGSRIGRIKKRKKLKKTIDECEKEIPELEKELEYVKEKSKYKVNTCKSNNPKLSSNYTTLRNELLVYMDSDKEKTKYEESDDMLKNIKILNLDKNTKKK